MVESCCLPVANEEMVEEDRDLQLGEIVPGAEPGAEPEWKECPCSRRRALIDNAGHIFLV